MIITKIEEPIDVEISSDEITKHLNALVKDEKRVTNSQTGHHFRRQLLTNNII